ncbi:ATP-dependent helicase/deoxyribonuclease subunit B [Halioglobus japonicus]|nr:ATP-dependent helicase/deoxyribonuclease subunit B [Halioglobus japonicus]
MALGLYDITALEPLIRQGYTLLTPNFRLARRIKAEWDALQDAQGMRVWEPLSVQPLEVWLQEQWEAAVSSNLLAQRIVLTSAQAVEIWRQLISQMQNQTPDLQLLRPSGAAELAAQARDTLLRWRVDWRTPGIRQQFELDGDCCTFLQWLDMFDRRLAQDGLCTASDCLAQLPGIAGSPDGTRVALVEFDMLAPLLRAALETLCAEVREVGHGAARADRLLHSCSDKRAELQSVAHWTAQLHRADPHTTIAIVLSDMAADRVPLEYLLRREFDCLGHNYASLPVNFSTGIPLAKVPLVRDALAVLALGLQETTIAAIEGLLRSRFLDLPDTQSALAQRFIQQLYAQGRATLAVTDLRNEANAVQLRGVKGLALANCLDALRATPGLRHKALPSQWLGRFNEMLNAWGWPGQQPLDSLEFQQLALWQRTLDEFATFDIVTEPMHFNEALALLRTCCIRQISQPQTADSPIQVLGPLEAAGLHFDHLWLCGMQGSSWPASPRPNPFIPVALQTGLQMPHANPEREWAFATALLQQYARTSSVIHGSYCRQVDGVPDLPSSLLQSFTEQALPSPAPVADSWRQRLNSVALENVEDHRAPSLEPDPDNPVTGGSGLLEDQSQCPFRAFAHHRLQVEPLATFYVGLSPSDRGSLLHAALDALWSDLGDSATLQALDEERQQQSVESAVQTAIATIPGHQQRKLGAAYWQLEAGRLRALLHEWLEVERNRSEFAVAEREVGMNLELAGLQIRLRVDRIDELPGGARVIIDYKSGRSSVKDWMGDRPARPQLLLYSIAEPETVAGLAFASVRPRECSYKGLGTTAAIPGTATRRSAAVASIMDAQGWADLNESWRRTLERLASEYVLGEAQVDPLTPSSCTWCGLQPLCRVESGTDATMDELADDAVTAAREFPA